METTVKNRRGSVVSVDAEGIGPFYVPFAYANANYSPGSPVNVEDGTIAPVRGDFDPCNGPECPEESEFLCDGPCGVHYCGYHIVHLDSIDLCDGCFGRRHRR